MSKIRIKNFGPIKVGFTETLPNGTVNEWLDVKKVTVFIGNQGSGKSTVAKLISTLAWIEKEIERLKTLFSACHAEARSISFGDRVSMMKKLHVFY